MIGQRTTLRDLAARLGRIDFEQVQLQARDGQEIRKGRHWRSPVGFDPEDG